MRAEGWIGDVVTTVSPESRFGAQRDFIRVALTELRGGVQDRDFFTRCLPPRGKGSRSMTELIAEAAAGTTAELPEHVTDGFSATLDGNNLM